MVQPTKKITGPYQKPRSKTVRGKEKEIMNKKGKKTIEKDGN